MSYHITIPKKLVYDKSIRDVDLRIYLIIAQNVNDDGYSIISNEKLIKLSGKSQPSVYRSLDNLVKSGHLIVKHHVKLNDIYPRGYDRVIWLSEVYSDYLMKRKAQRTKIKTKENDFNVFVMWLRTDCLNIEFLADIGGLTQKYAIHNDGYMWVHPKGEQQECLDKYDASDVFKQLWRTKKNIFSRIHGETEAFKNLLEAYNYNSESEK